MEALCLLGPNVASFQLVMGRQRWHVMGCYIAPDNASAIEGMVAAISRRPRGAKLLVAGNFNTDLVKPEGTTRVEEIAAELAAADLEDMSAHFLPRYKPWSRDRHTWGMRHGDQVVYSQTNYLLGTDRRMY